MFSVIRGGKKTNDLLVYVKWNWNPPCLRRIESSHKLTPILFASYFLLKTWILTRTYFARGQVPDCPDVTRA